MIHVRLIFFNDVILFIYLLIFKLFSLYWGIAN